RGGGGTHLGIENLAKRGIAGRGVLADVSRFFERRGRIVECTRGDTITLKDLEAALAEQRTRVKPGDVLLLRTGWLKSYLGSSQEVRVLVSQQVDSPGIEATKEVAGWLWDHRI